jgi:hypothetical protein
MTIFTYFQLLVISIRSIVIIKLLLSLHQSTTMEGRLTEVDSHQSKQLHIHRHRLFIGQILK